MGKTLSNHASIDHRIARHLRILRTGRGWSLEELAGLSGVSRATLSRLENAEVSPTTSVLARLCAAHGLSISRLLLMAEEEYTPLLRRDAQPLWRDPAGGFRRRVVSTPTRALAGEILECELEPDTRIAYEVSPRAGLEHHLLLLSGQLAVTVEGQTHELQSGDCLRYRLLGPSAFATPGHVGARYLLFLV